MAVAIGRSPAQKILIPTSRCGVNVVGLAEKSFSELISLAVQKTAELLG